MKKNNYTLKGHFARWVWQTHLIVCCILSFVMIGSLRSNAQTLNDYVFTQTQETYVPITEGTVQWSGYDGFDDQTVSLTPTTPFTFQGVSYSTIFLSANGYVLFGSTVTTNTPIAAGRNAVAAFAVDLDAKGASAGTGIPEVRHEQVGDEFVIQWSNVCRYTGSGATSAENLNFQIRLNTANSGIKIIYGPCTDRATPVTIYPQVGLGGGSATLYKNRTITAGTGDWINSTAGTANNQTMAFNGTTIPSSGLTYAWMPAACTGIPNPGNTLASTDLPCTGMNFTLSLENVLSGTGLSYQWESADDLEFTSNVQVIGTTSTVVTSQTTPKYYRSIVSCESEPTPGISTPLFLDINTVPCYCSYCPVAFASAVEPITLVEFAGISNATDATVNGTPALQDFTSISGLVFQGQVNIPIKVKGNTDGDFTTHVNAFIDLNQDGDFLDAGENYYLGTIVNSTGTDAVELNAQISIPSDALVGITRLRITKRFTTQAGPCNTAGFGQAEDYCLSIIAAPSCMYPTSIAVTNITSSGGVFTWNPSTSTVLGGYNWQVLDDTESVVASGNTADTTVTVTTLDQLTAYTFQVQAVCETGVDSSPWMSVNFNTIASCLPPSAVVVSGILTSSATMSWTSSPSNPADGYYWEIRDALGTVIDSGTTQDTSATTSLLSAQTSYTAYIQSICDESNSESVFVSSSIFTTLCSVFSTPFLEAFSTGVIPNCWSTTSSNPVANGLWKFAGQADYAAAANGRPASTFAWVDGSDPSTISDVTLYSPLIDVDPLTVPYLEFDYFGNTTETYPNNIFTVQVSNGTTWQTIFTDNTSDPDWRTIGIPLTGYTGIIQLRFIVDKTPPAVGWAFYNDILLDEVKVIEAPTCPAPITLNAQVSNTSATLSWVSAGDLFDIEWGPAGFAQGTGNLVEGVSTTSYLLENLAIDNTYSFYVRQDCGDNDGVSVWVGPINFHLGYCQVTSTSQTYGISHFGTSGGFTNIDNPSGPGSYSNYSETISASYYAGGTLDFSITSANGTAGMGLWIDWNNDFDFNDAGEQVYNSAAYVSVGTGTITVPAGTPNGNYRMRVVANFLSTTPIACGNLGNAANGEAEDYTFTVTPPPACPPPINLTANVNTTSVTLNWNELITPSEGYEYVLSLTNELPTESGTIVTGLTATIDDLIIGSTYYAFVRSVCGDEDGSSTWATTSFYIGYCLPTSTYTSDHISHFGTSNALINVNSPTAGGAPYTDNSAMVITEHVGGAFNFSTTFVGGSNAVNIWIDWNNNLVFEDSENVFFLANSDATKTGEITIPVDAETGNYRLRIRSQFSTTSNPPACGNISFGEAEDYTLQIVDIPTCLPPSNLQGFATSVTEATVSWTSLFPPADGYEYFVTQTIGIPTTNGIAIADTTVNLTELSFGIYYVYVRANCGDEDGFSLWAGPVAINIFEGDDPCIAIELPVLGACQFQTFDNTGATTSDPANIQAPGCASYNGSDMWFTFVVPANGIINIDATPGSMTDAGAALYMSASDCNGYLSVIECDDDDSDNGAMPAMSLSNLVPGTVLYLRVWEFGGNAIGTFGICVSSPCSAPGLPTLTPSGNTVTATWPTAGDGLTYNWELRESGNPGSGSEGLVASGTTEADVLTVTIEDLNYASPYVFYVSTNCGDVTSLWSNGVNVVTEVPQGCTDPEACNYDANAMVDNNTCIYETTTLYRDFDGDGYGDAEEEYESCGPTTDGYVDNSSDCDDTDASVWQSSLLYIDADGDGYDVGQQTVCYGDSIPSGFATETNGHDCDDEDEDSFGPSPVEVTLNMPIDEVCDNSAAFTLTGGSPAGGTWSGTGVTNGSFNPAGIAPGFYQITYTVAGDGICTTTGSQTAELEVDDCTNIDELDASVIRLFPTFTNNHVTVVGFDLKEAVVMDAHGKRLNTVSLMGNNIIDMQSYAAGIYFIHVTSNTATNMFKVVRVH
jgi:hypothetical protein